MNIGSKCLNAIFATGVRKPQKNWTAVRIKYALALLESLPCASVIFHLSMQCRFRSARTPPE